MTIESYQKRTWLEVDLSAIKSNFQTVRKSIRERTKICCVVKANAYGLGAIELARIYEQVGADFLAVSNIEEAMQLRLANIRMPILILGYTDPHCAKILSAYNISQCVYSLKYAEELSNSAAQEGCVVKVHFKIDTGMGRIGFRGNNIDETIKDIYIAYHLPNFESEGIFTHFASADEGVLGEDYTNQQFNEFISIINLLKSKKCIFALSHCANSATIFDFPNMQLNMVRAGIVLYGIHPSTTMKTKLNLLPTIRLKAVVSLVKNLEKGDCVSYGRKYVAESRRRIATLSIGYADGLWRSNSQKSICVEINGVQAPYVGRICMDQCMIDVTGIDVKAGDVATIYGGSISIENVAQANDTIAYELLCAISARVPRVYIENEKTVDITDYSLWHA